MRPAILAALAGLSAAADAATTLTGPADPFSVNSYITGGTTVTFGALPSETLSHDHPNHFSSTPAVSVQTTLSIWTFGPVYQDMPTLVASVISADPTATVLYLTCAPPSDLDVFDDCGLGPGLTVTQMGSTAMVDQLTQAGAFTWSESCTFPVSPSAVCVQSAGGSEANFNGVLTTTLQPSESVWIAVEVTAGAELLTAATGKATATGKGGSTTAANGSASATGKSSAAAGRSWVGVSAAGFAAGAFAVGIALL
jgi:hypothetical protein